MIIGKIKKNERTIKFDLDIKCTNCGKKVPGGIKTSKKYYDTDEFKLEVKNFKKNYLCGKCRDRKRVMAHSAGFVKLV